MANTKAEGFAIIPNWVIRETNLSAYALLVYLVLTSRTNSNGECWPSLRTIDKESRCSVSSARRAINELVSAGVLTVTRRRRESDGAQTSNIYKVLIGHSKAPVSGRTGPMFVENSQEEEPSQEDSNTELKPTLASGRHSSSSTASKAQITFLADCFVLLHQAKPERYDYGRWELLTSAEAHEEIRSYWAEIEQGNDFLLQDAINDYRAELSPRAINYIETRLGMK